MTRFDKANEYYDEVVRPTIQELVDEYNINNKARSVDGEGNIVVSGVRQPNALGSGIHVIFSDEAEKKVAVNWSSDSDKIRIGPIGEEGIYLIMRDCTNALLKSTIKACLGENELGTIYGHSVTSEELNSILGEELAENDYNEKFLTNNEKLGHLCLLYFYRGTEYWRIFFNNIDDQELIARLTSRMTR